MLKIVAWKDRHTNGNKDADDIGFILTNYFTINEKSTFNKHYDLYEDADFTIHTAGAKLLGRDIAEMLIKHPDTKNKILQILQLVIDKQEESILINQILETNRRFNYEELLKCLNNILVAFKD